MENMDTYGLGAPDGDVLNEDYDPMRPLVNNKGSRKKSSSA